jgi:hypothetical protein
MNEIELLREIARAATRFLDAGDLYRKFGDAWFDTLKARRRELREKIAAYEVTLHPMEIGTDK